MIIDWYTVIFQVINFLALVFLLRFFLYGPIIKAMDAREQKIVQREEEALDKARSAGEEARVLREKTKMLESREEEIMEKAREAAEEERRDLAQAARREMSETRLRWEEAFDRERESFIRELRVQVGRQASLVAGRLLRDMADSSLQDMVTRVFLGKLHSLPAGERDRLRESASQSQSRVSIVSAFDIPGEQLEEIKGGLQEILSGHVTVDYEVDPQLICGLELEVGGYRVAWSVKNYLAEVEEEIMRVLGRSEQVREAAMNDESEG